MEAEGTITISKSAEGGIEEQHVNLEAVLSQQISINEIGGSLSAEDKYIILKRLQLDDVVSQSDLPLSAAFMIEKVEKMDENVAYEVLKRTAIDHDNDPNFPDDAYSLIMKLIKFKDPSFEIADENETRIIAYFRSKFSGPENASEKDTTSEESVTNEKAQVTEKAIEVDNRSDFENFDQDYYENIFDWVLQVRIEAALIEYWSPYPEVRSATAPFDDPSELCETWRAYVAGIIWVGISSFINQYFKQRFPSISLPSAACQVLIYPTGLVLSLIPSFKIPLLKGYVFDSNPGKWTNKEQMLATMMVAITSTPYIEGPLFAQRMPTYYGKTWVTWGYQVLLGLSTQFIGFGLAGIVRKFCIYPIKSVWPTILPTVVTNRALLIKDKKENINGWTISRYYYFFAIFTFSFIWYWVPGYLFTALSYFSWLTWIKPYNFNLSMVTGFNSGLGLNPIPTFDWNNLSVLANPLAIPAFNTINNAFGVAIGFFAIIGIYYSNYYWSAYLPINSSATFSNTGDRYDVSQVMNEKGELDIEKYQKYGPPFYSAANLVLYGTFFASYPFTILYTCATNWKDISYATRSLGHSLRQWRSSSLEGFNDPHSKMMRQYKEVPEWVFLIVLVIAIVLGIICVEIYPTNVPVWGIFFTVAMNFVFLIPFTVLYSITGYQLTMNVLIELIVGYALPGKPDAHLILKSFGTQTDIQAQDYISNQKIGHYSKIPPWAAFRVQLLATLISLFISLAVINWQISSFDGLCTPHQELRFTCAGDAQIYFSASVLWGLIGPRRIFGGLYPMLKWCFLIGFLLTFPCYIIFRIIPKKYRKWWQPAIIIGSILNYFAPYNLSYFIGGFYLCLLFMVYLKKNYLAWWEKYNYLTTAGMTSGLALSSIILFFAVQYHPKDLNWWGNDVVGWGIEGGYGQQTLKDPATAPDGYFGPRIGHFP